MLIYNGKPLIDRHFVNSYLTATKKYKYEHNFPTDLTRLTGYCILLSSTILNFST